MIRLVKRKKIAGIGLVVLMGCTAPAASLRAQQTEEKQKNVQTENLEGAWELRQPDGATAVKLVQDGFFTVAAYDQAGKEFVGTYGGTYTLQNGKLTATYEFNTFDSTLVGKSASGSHQLTNNQWQLTGIGRAMKGTETWQRIDESKSTSPLTGTWRITGRERDGQMSTMRPGPRKTFKVLSGSRFQWIAFNSETGEFSGTGGGTYTTQNGKYTENIAFFSRDNNRVGQSLSFNYEVKDGNWHHSGQSSTGNNIYEIWSRISSQ